MKAVIASRTTQAHTVYPTGTDRVERCLPSNWRPALERAAPYGRDTGTDRYRPARRTMPSA
jgi:hypothetical protein